MSISTPSDAGEENGGEKSTAKNKGVIMVTQDGVENYLLSLQPTPRPPYGMGDVAAVHVSGATEGNGAREWKTILNLLLVG